jgi:hypothetical protein
MIDDLARLRHFAARYTATWCSQNAAVGREGITVAVLNAEPR